MRKNIKKIIIFIIITLIILIILLLLQFINNFNLQHKDNLKSYAQESFDILFEFSYTNNAWGHTNYGYIIYENGIIQQYDNSDEKNIENPKKDKITKKELKQLKKLANKVEDKYEINEGHYIFDVGRSEKVIYSNKLSKFVVLSRWGDEIGSNSTKTSEKILNLTEKLYNKYLNN